MSEVLFTPDPERIKRSRMRRFMLDATRRYGAPPDDWRAFHRWSVTRLEDFWRLVLEHTSVICTGSPDPVVTSRDVETARFFPKLQLSYAENLLRGDEKELAILAIDETGAEQNITRGALRRSVARAAGSLRKLGLAAGDRVVAVTSNRIDTIVACLAATSIGATWSSCAPDMGIVAMRERFKQLKPKMLFWHSSYLYQGQRHELHQKIKELAFSLTSLSRTITLDAAPLVCAAHARASSLQELIDGGSDDFEFPRFPFDHPLFTLFSSGTTGPPKCIVHGVGGTLLTHLKEHSLHTDLGPGERLYFQTSCGWMMWNWVVSALASGACIVLYDGSPTHPTALVPWRVCERLRVTAFGTSPTFLQLCKGLKMVPQDKCDLASLRQIMSTGSVLSDTLFRWVAQSVRADMPLSSISGGTDIVGCFLQGNPLLPVHAGELQCKSLGMDVHSYLPDAHGQGELICKSPFPSRPVAFFGDTDGSKLHAAYYEQNHGCWTHGDLIEETPTGFKIHGRSDGVMNIRGVRIGPGEIYKALETVAEIADTLAVEQRVRDENLFVLFVVVRDNRPLDLALQNTIKKTLKDACSPAHVPARIVAVPGVPYTHSGKKSERAVRDVLAGRSVANRAALRNPESLETIARLAAPQRV